MLAYTPRRIAALLFLRRLRERRERREALAIAALGASGDRRALTKALKELERDLP